jgi:ribosomal protein S4E
LGYPLFANHCCNRTEYDDTTGILSIPEVEAFGKHYKIQLNNQGDFLFQLIEAHEVSDEDGHFSLVRQPARA